MMPFVVMGRAACKSMHLRGHMSKAAVCSLKIQGNREATRISDINRMVVTRTRSEPMRPIARAYIEAQEFHLPLGCKRLVSKNERVMIRRKGQRRWTSGGRSNVVEVPAFTGLRDLATLLRVNAKVLFKALGGIREKKKWRVVLQGTPYAFPSLGSVVIPFKEAKNIAKELNKKIIYLDTEVQRKASLPPGTDKESRTPVVVLLGHYNHGKTTLLDAMIGPTSKIVSNEPRGITQEIRARTVNLCEPAVEESGRSILDSNGTVTELVATFLDTPGQEIFYRMRNNGARVADCVVLVVSAVEGVCLQTKESMGCAEELGLPTVVAVNKMDLLPEGEEARKHYESLVEEIHSFEATHNARVVPVSALMGQGMEELRSAIASALSDPITGGQSSLHLRNRDNEIGRENVHESSVSLPAPPRAAMATVLEYISSPKQGKMMLLLVAEGVLCPGDWFVSGYMWGSVKSLYNQEGWKRIEQAGPGMAVQVVFTPMEKLADAPLGEPFRVLARDASQKVVLVRKLEVMMKEFIDHYKLEKEGQVLAEEEISGSLGYDDDTEDEEYEEIEGEVGNGNLSRDSESSFYPIVSESCSQVAVHNELEEYNGSIPMVVVKTDTANTLASVLDALHDWGASDGATVVKVVHASVGAVTSANILLAKDCECAVFAHNVRLDATAKKELGRWGRVVASSPLRTILSEGASIPQGKGNGKQVGVVVAETVEELLLEIKHFAQSFEESLKAHYKLE
ncbi:unnamed protein product [Choristocarpus tenellus]